MELEKPYGIVEQGGIAWAGVVTRGDPVHRFLSDLLGRDPLDIPPLRDDDYIFYANGDEPPDSRETVGILENLRFRELTRDEGDEEGVTGTSLALHEIAEKTGAERVAWNEIRLPAPGDGELNPAASHSGRTVRRFQS